MSETLSLELSLPATALVAGIHAPGVVLLHTDRVLDCFELIFVQQGVLPIAEGQRQFHVQAGQTLLLFPGRRHRGTHACPPEMWFYWICFRVHSSGRAASQAKPRVEAEKGPEYLHENSPERMAVRLPTRHGIGLPQLAKPAQRQRLVELFQRFLGDQKAGCLRPHTADLLLAMMFDQVTAPPQVEDRRAGQVLAHRAGAYIDAQLARPGPLGAAQVASALRCNADYLGRVFRAAFGRSLVEHIHHRRVEKACALLQASGMSVDEIALACGHPDVRYFRRLFKRHAGMTPLAYRARHSRG